MSRSRRFWRMILVVVICLLAAELGARIFWAVKYHRPLLGKPGLLYSFYPELRGVHRLTDSRRSGRLDVLILGGSVISNAWGNISTVLTEELSRVTDKNIGVVNLARPAHTTLDSYLKYALLGEYPFDVVVIYHGVNDARTNNCPPGVFRDDYSHYSWYHDLSRLLAHKEASFLVLPYTLEMLMHRVEERMGGRVILPTAQPSREWLDHGSNIKSAGPFRRNMERIIELAKQRNQKILLQTFAFYLSKDYSAEKFRARELDYSFHSAPLEAWGEPQCVAKAVAVHNEIIHDLAAQDSTLFFLDQATRIPHEATFFNDACHLTGRGCLVFGEGLARAVAAAVGA